ncbi:hypothetical protein EGW08_022740, partial [Elysia chlorotica]
MSWKEGSTSESSVVMMSSRNDLTQESQMADSPASEISELRSLLHKSMNFTCKKPPIPTKISPCYNTGNAPSMSDSDTLVSYSFNEERHRRLLSTHKCGVFDSSNKHASTSSSTSSRGTNLHQKNGHVSHSDTVDSDTQSDNSKKTKEFPSPELVHSDLKRNRLLKTGLVSKHQGVKNFDQNLNKQVDAVTKDNLNEVVNANNDLVSSIYTDECSEGESINAPSHCKSISSKGNESRKRVTIKLEHEDRQTQEKYAYSDISTTSSKQKQYTKDKTVTNKEFSEAQGRLDAGRSTGLTSPPSEFSESDSGPGAHSNSITNPSVQNPPSEFSERRRRTPDYQGSVYDYYYKDEMTFPTPPHYVPKRGRGARRANSRRRCQVFEPPGEETEKPRVLWRPHRGVIFFQPDSNVGGPPDFAPTPQSMKMGVQFPDWECLEGGGFPSYHRLSSSSDLNREMKMAMRYHNCRQLPKIGASEKVDTIEPHLYFHTHGWFPRSTTGMMHLKYRENLSQVKRYWYETWNRETTFRNAVKESSKKRWMQKRIESPTDSSGLETGYPNPGRYALESTDQSCPYSFSEDTLEFINRTSTGGVCSSPVGPSGSPRCAQIREAEPAPDSIGTMSQENADSEHRTCSPTDNLTHSREGSCYSDSEVNSRDRSTTPSRSVHSHQRLHHQHEKGKEQRVPLEIETETNHRRQAGDSTGQTPVLEMFNRFMPSEREQNETSCSEGSKFSSGYSNVKNKPGERF